MDGNYSNHIAKVYSIVSQHAGVLLRTLMNRSPEHLRFLWHTYLEPHIDYTPYLTVHIKVGT